MAPNGCRVPAQQKENDELEGSEKSKLSDIQESP